MENVLQGETALELVMLYKFRHKLSLGHELK